MTRSGLWDAEDDVSLAEFAELLLEAESAEPTPEAVRTKTVGLRMARRRGTFPEPVLDTGRTQRFALGALLDWLEQERKVAVTPSARWSLARAIEIARRDVGDEAAKHLALATLLDLAGEPTPAPAPDIADTSAGLSERLRKCLEANLTAGTQPAALAEMIIASLSGVTRPGAGRTTTDAVAELLLAVADIRAGERILDPACGEGGLLLAAHAQDPRCPLHGRELDLNAWWIASVRHQLHGTGADLGQGPVDSLVDGAVRQADVVLLDPPFGVGASEGTMSRRNPGRWLFDRWLGVALDGLAAGGRAAVALPGRTVDADRRQERARVGAHLRALVLAPDRLRADVGEEVVVWELTAEDGDGRALVVDVSRSVDRLSARKRVEPASIEALRKFLALWRRNGVIPHQMSSQLASKVLDVDDLAALIRSGLAEARSDEDERAMRLVEELETLLAGDLRHHATAELLKSLDRLKRRLPTGTTASRRGQGVKRG